jgi:hypothetical protein
MHIYPMPQPTGAIPIPKEGHAVDRMLRRAKAFFAHGRSLRDDCETGDNFFRYSATNAEIRKSQDLPGETLQRMTIFFNASERNTRPIRGKKGSDISSVVL